MPRKIHAEDLRQRTRKRHFTFRAADIVLRRLDHYAASIERPPSTAAAELLEWALDEKNIPKQLSHLDEVIRSSPAARSAEKQDEIIDQRMFEKFGPARHPTQCAHCGATEFFDWITAEVPHFGLCNMTPVGGCGKRSDMADYYREGE